MARRGALVLFVALGVGACSWFHRPTPQQQLLDALNRGDGVQATHLWLTMSEKDRMKFNSGQGLTPAVPPKDVIKKLSEMSPEDMQGTVTISPPGEGSSLMDLLKLATPQAAAPARSNAVQTSEPIGEDEQP